jgi:hypothetical protein
MHQRGKPFPESVRENYDELELAALGLQQLTDYYRCSVEKKVLKKRAVS